MKPEDFVAVGSAVLMCAGVWGLAGWAWAAVFVGGLGLVGCVVRKVRS